MSKILGDSESLGKSNGKKDLKTLLIKGVKLLRKKKIVFGEILQGSVGYTTRIRRLYYKDHEVIQLGSGGYTTRIRSYTTRIRRLGFLTRL